MFRRTLAHPWPIHAEGVQHSSIMEPSARKDEEDSGGGRRCHLPPPPASWPAAGAVNRGHGHGEGHGHSKCPQGPAQQVASRLVLPLRSGFDEDFEVRLPGRGDTTFFVRVAGRELAATNGVAVVIHGVRKTLEKEHRAARNLQIYPHHLSAFMYTTAVPRPNAAKPFGHTF